jgi:uncharacterized membrane protein
VKKFYWSVLAVGPSVIAFGLMLFPTEKHVVHIGKYGRAVVDGPINTTCLIMVVLGILITIGSVVFTILYDPSDKHKTEEAH